MSDQSNSTELTILGHAPQMVARAFDQARSPLGDNRDRLRRKFAFVDTLLRYLFAVLAAENAGLGQPLPDKCRSLINRLANPAWGDWSKAVEALARSILSSPGQPVAPEFATLIVAPDDSGGWEPTEFHTALIALIALRNKVAHEDGSVFCTEEQAGQYLKDAVNPGLQRLGPQLRAFVRKPLFYVSDSGKHLLSGEVVVTYLRLVGEKPEKIDRRSDTAPALRPCYPFLLNEDGTALYLSPFVMVEGAAGSGAPAPRLIDGWDEGVRQPTYDTPDGKRRQRLASPPEDMPSSPGNLLDLPPRLFRQESAVAPEIAAELVTPRRIIHVDVEIPGLVIDRNRPLGSGASGAVYPARWISGGRGPGEWLALKVLRDTTLADIQRQRLEGEYEVLRRIQHRCLPRVHTFGYEPLPYFLMDKVEGSSLQARIERKPLPLETVVWMAREILDVLEDVHDKGVIHRDLKPSNIMIAEDDSSLKVIDFGIAVTDTRKRITGSLELLGTHGYAAPEQFEKGDIDHRVDIYGLGRVLQEALLGGRLDRMDTIPPGMRAIIHRATQPNRENRFVSAAEMLDALDQRQAGGWEGAPVQENSPLDTNHQLLELKHSIDGVWVYDAIERTTGRREAIALAVEPTARQKLLKGVKQQPEGACTTQITVVHAILYTVLPPNDEADRLDRLLRGRPLWTLRRIGKPARKPVAEATIPLGDEETEFRRALLGRLEEVKRMVDRTDSDHDVLAACLEASSTMESIMLSWSLFAQRTGTIDIERWRACPQTLGGIVGWIGKLRLPYERIRELLESVGHVANIRNQLAHARTGASAQEVSHAVMFACSCLEAAVNAVIPTVGPLDHPPYLTFDQAHQAWRLLRPIQDDDRFEVFDLRWHRRYELEETVGGKAAVTVKAREADLSAYLATRPYAGEVVQQAMPSTNVKGRSPARRREADIAVYSPGGEIVLVAEVKAAGTSALRRTRLQEQLWMTARAFKAPFALLDEEGNRTWFVVDPDKGLSEIPDDGAIVARFSRPAP